MPLRHTPTPWWIGLGDAVSDQLVAQVRGLRIDGRHALVDRLDDATYLIPPGTRKAGEAKRRAFCRFFVRRMAPGSPVAPHTHRSRSWSHSPAAAPLVHLCTMHGSTRGASKVDSEEFQGV